MRIDNPSIEEMRNDIFGMNANGALGPDGFGEFFYEHYSNIISNDVFNAVLQCGFFLT